MFTHIWSLVDGLVLSYLLRCRELVDVRLGPENIDSMWL